MPFLFLQLLVTGRYLAGRKFLSPTFQVLAIYSCSLLFCLFWQFAQFVFLLQALVLFCLATVGLLDRDKVFNKSSLVFTFILMQVSHVLAIYWCSLLSVWYLQFYQPMLVTSLVVSFIPVAILSVQVRFFNMSNCRIFGLSKRWDHITALISSHLISIIFSSESVWPVPYRLNEKCGDLCSTSSSGSSTDSLSQHHFEGKRLIDLVKIFFKDFF